jgi:paraquat-inducible protein B
MSSPDSHSPLDQEIGEHEKELKELLRRVMREPLEPALKGVEHLQEQLGVVEDKVRDLRDADIPELWKKLRKIQEAVDDLRANISDEMPKLLASQRREVLSSTEKMTQSLDKNLASLDAGFSGIAAAMVHQGKQLQQSSDQLSKDLLKALERMTGLEAHQSRLQIGTISALILALVALLISLLR